MSEQNYDESVVQALVLQAFGNCPDLGDGQLRAKVTWCALGDCPERREADKRIAAIKVTSGKRNYPKPDPNRRQFA